MKNQIVDFLLLSLVMISSCSTNANDPRQIVMKEGGDVQNATWDNFFEDEQEIRFSYPDSTFALLSIGSFLINMRGDYIIADGSSKAVKRFDSTGRFLQVIGKWGGAGPGEFSILGSFALNNEDDLLVFDAANYRLSRFAAPDYLYAGDMLLEIRPSGIITAPDGHIITFSYSEKMLNKIDASGRILRRAFKPTEKLRLFNARFKLGGIADNSGRGFFFVYPENYEILSYDYDLNPVMTVRFEGASRFRPTVPEFPPELSPYSFSPAHSAWWDGFLHAYRICDLGNDFWGICLYQSEKMSYKGFYLNIYDFSEKKIRVEGLKTPKDGIIRYAKDGCVYVVVEPQIGEKDEITPLKLYRYKFKEPFRQDIVAINRAGEFIL